MKQILNLMKIDVLNSRRKKHKSKTRRWIAFSLKVVSCFLIAFLISLVASYFIKLFYSSNLQIEFIILLITLFQLIIFSLTTAQMIKCLRSTKKINYTLTLPVSPIKLFLSEILVYYFKQLLLSILVLAPIFITYATITMCGGVYFYLMMLPSIILITSAPFCIGVLLSVLVIKIVNLIEKSPLVLLILFVAIISAFFVIYVSALKWLLVVFENEDTAGLISAQSSNMISKISYKLYFALLFSNVLLNINSWKSLIIIIAILSILLLAIYFLVKHYFLDFFRNSLSLEKKAKKVRYKLKKSCLTATLLKKDFTIIFRSSNYLFSYLSIVLATPILVFFCNIIVSELGLKITGSMMFPAIVFIELALFIVIGAAFSATTITREGRGFAVMKTMPIKAKTEIKAKILLYCIVSIPIVFFTSFILFAAGYISLINCLVIAFSVSVFVYGSICFGINKDLKSPKISKSSGKEVALYETNMSFYVTWNVIFVLILGFASIISIYMFPLYVWQIGTLVATLVFALFMRLSLSYKLSAKYNKIEF